MTLRKFLFALQGLLCLVVVMICCGVIGKGVSPVERGRTTISINGSSTGRVFDGIGAISGGGGNSRYLVDYPQKERNQIMEYLFKPDFGASLQILKVEIGGDSDTTDGAELSVEHSLGIVNCNVGYEWSIMKAAQKLNPKIKFYALAWGAPGWVNQWTSSSIDYLMTWLGCAKQHHFQISYLGGWNESAFHSSQMVWFEALRAALNQNGFSHVQIVGVDERTVQFDPANSWVVANAMARNAKFDAAISIAGAHNVCYFPTTGIACEVTKNALQLNKPLWASELGHMYGDSGAADMVRALNRGYIDAKITGFITWPIVDSMPPGLPHERYGLIFANQPWSGNYAVNKMTWAIAQTTQFTQPGWRYMQSAAGYLQGNRANGSYVALKSTDGRDWSMIAETTTSNEIQKVTVNISGGLKTRTVHVWATNLDSSSPATWFVQMANITPTKGQFTYTLKPGYVYSFTTTTGQGKGLVGTVPRAQSFPLPYSSALNKMDSSDEAAYLATMNGAFEGAPCLGGAQGTCLQQSAPQAPLIWESTNIAHPYAIIGDDAMSNYTISTKTLFTQSGSSAGLLGRFFDQNNSLFCTDGYAFDVAESGNWEIRKYSTETASTLVSGHVAALGVDQWNNIAFSLKGDQLLAAINGRIVGHVTDGSYQTGPAGIESGAAVENSWSPVQYRDLEIKPQ